LAAKKRVVPLQPYSNLIVLLVYIDWQNVEKKVVTSWALE